MKPINLDRIKALRQARPYRARQASVQTPRQAGYAFHGNAHAELTEVYQALDFISVLAERVISNPDSRALDYVNKIHMRARESQEKVVGVMGMIGEEDIAERQACPMCEAHNCPIHP